MTELEKIATDCRAAAGYYEEKPGHVGPEATIDLYRTIERLAKELQKHRARAVSSKASNSQEKP